MDIPGFIDNCLLRYVFHQKIDLIIIKRSKTNCKQIRAK